MFWVLLYLPAVLPAYSVVRWFRDRSTKGWVHALGWMTLCVIPALIYQSIWWVSAASPYSASGSSVLLAAPVGLWVLLGGWSCVAVFEATVRDLTGHRMMTMVDNAHVFVVLIVIQTAIVVAVLIRAKPALRRAIGAGVLGNALLASHWPWWGS